MVRVPEPKSFHGPDWRFQSRQGALTHLSGGSGDVTSLFASLSLKERLISSGRGSPEDNTAVGRTKGATYSDRLDGTV